MKPKIAVIGAGLAGLATGYFLSLIAEVTVFDSKGVGGGASGMAAGLMHPYVGQTGKLNLYGKEGMQASLALIPQAKKGIIRIATNEKMAKAMAASAEFRTEGSRFFFEEGYTVDIPHYLHFLMGHIEKNGGRLIQQEVEDAYSLEGFDRVILCMGASTPFAPITKVAGRLLELKWPSHIPPLPYPISGDGYVIPKKESCIVGATYERQPLTEEQATSELLSKAEGLVPGLSQTMVLDIRSGIRATTKDRLPIIEKREHNLFVYTGLGSRGLLYHALFAKRLASQL